MWATGMARCGAGEAVVPLQARWVGSVEAVTRCAHREGESRGAAAARVLARPQHRRSRASGKRSLSTTRLRGSSS
uniref:Uncharacterized protein n=1 Tax=Arundo donax TaxID=35708 RepID=A0A0A9AH66_ARUDO